MVASSRAQTSTEFLVLTAGVVLLALIVGYYTILSARQIYYQIPLYDFNGGSHSGSKKVDNPPLVSVSVSPTSGDTSTVFTITCSASDDKGVVSVQIGDGGSVLKSCTTAPCTVSSTFSSGEHNAVCIAKDTTGQTALDSATFDVVISCSDSCSPAGKVSYSCSDGAHLATSPCRIVYPYSKYRSRTCGNYDADPCLEWSGWTELNSCDDLDGYYGGKYRDYFCDLSSPTGCSYVTPPLLFDLKASFSEYRGAGMHVTGSRLIIVSSSSIKLLDISGSRKYSPSLLSETQIVGNDVDYVNSYVEGNILAITTEERSSFLGGTIPVLHVYDISDPYNVKEIDKAGLLGFFQAVAVKYPYVYVADCSPGPSRWSLLVYRIDTSGDLKYVKAVKFGDTSCAAADLEIFGDRLFFPPLDGKLYVFDLSNPASPKLQWIIPMPHHSQFFASDGKYLYVTGNGVDIVDPLAPVPSVLGTCSTCVYSYAGRPAVDGGYLYFPDYGTVFVVDVSDKGHPVRVETYDGDYDRHYAEIVSFGRVVVSSGAMYAMVSAPQAGCSGLWVFSVTPI